MLYNRILTESKKEIPLAYMNEITIFELRKSPVQQNGKPNFLFEYICNIYIKIAYT